MRAPIRITVRAVKMVQSPPRRLPRRQPLGDDGEGLGGEQAERPWLVEQTARFLADAMLVEV